tara:strand:+ start:93 stop:611 length:519 start_codon:yes stop_codon:yes gene_type:complete
MEEILIEIQKVNVPFWKTFDFWLFLTIGLSSFIASIKAFIEAKAAKTAANEAGQTVKIQTITIELSEIIQKLDKLETNIEFSDARDFLSEINRRIKRLTSPFKKEDNYEEVIALIYETLDITKDSLTAVRPLDNETIVDNAVYFAVEKHFSDLGGLLAELMGYFEKRTIKLD